MAPVFLVCLLNLQAHAGVVLRGSVIDARDGHPIRHAEVFVSTDNIRIPCNGEGAFNLDDLPAGSYTLRVSAFGYRPLITQIQKTDAAQTLSIKLVPSQFGSVDVISVTAADGRAQEDQDHPNVAMSATDMENLASVLADDPLRAVQALPGVTSNDDFEAQFSLRGEDFGRVGIYLDGVLLHDALHSLQGTDLSGSASVFDASLIQGIELYTDARPEALADTSGAALSVQMRQGDYDRYSFQVTANLAGAGFSAGGPLGRVEKCSWIAGFRKTYLQYILANILTDPSMAFGLTDGEGQLSCVVNAKNAVSLELVDSYTDLNRTALKKTLGANDVMLVGQHATATNLSWTYAPDEKTVMISHAAWMDDKFNAQNPATEPLGNGSYNEWAFKSNVTRALASSDSLSIGGSYRFMHDGGFAETYDSVRSIELLDLYHGSDTLAGGYIENSWAALPNRLRLTAGGRWERSSTDGVSTYSPQAGFAWRLAGALQMEAGWGQYIQYPTASIFGSNLGSVNLLPMRSTQASVALEERLFSKISVRAEFYDRQDRDLLYQPYADPRVINGAVFIPPVNPRYENSLRGYGRGVEVSLRRSTSKGLTGWLSYAYGRSEMRDGVTGDKFASDFDQRHTVNAYASYAIRPSVNISARWTYGSGFPVSGFLTAVGPPALENFYLTDQRNTQRIGPYQRLDLRVNKTWSHESRRKTTLYAEVTNLTDKDNYRFGSLDAYNVSNRATYVTVDQMFPILPSAGVVFSW